MLYFRKKGQLQIGITIMVLLVFIILLVTSLIFYFRFTQESIKEIRQEILDERYSGLLDAIINLPELRYSFSGAEKNCLDSVKLDNFDNIISGGSTLRRIYYNNLLGSVNAIWVDIIDIDVNTFSVDVDPERYEVYKKKGTEGLIYSSPVSVCGEDKNKVGKLNIQIK